MLTEGIYVHLGAERAIAECLTACPPWPACLGRDLELLYRLHSLDQIYPWR